MKGLSTLTSSRAKQSIKGLTTIQGKLTNRSDILNNNYSSSNLQQINQVRGYYPCAYHVGQRITNFCINSNCLLPLCPKCIKIHSQQHQKMGIHGNFATIDQCIYECQNTQNESLNRLQQILYVCQQMSTLHKQQIIICQSQLNKAKQQLIDYINNIFSFYQQEVDKLIIQSARDYQQQMILYHKQIATLMISQKILSKKAQNTNLKLQFLIDFYSKPDLTVLLNTYAAKIQSIKPQYLQLTINTYQLERIKVIIKKYLDFGSYNQSIQRKLQNNLAYQRATIVSKIPQKNQNYSSSYSLVNDNLKQFVRSPIRNLFSTPSQPQFKTQIQSYGFTQKGEIARQIQDKLSRQSMLDRFQSPLQNYSLQKSRRSRA